MEGKQSGAPAGTRGKAHLEPPYRGAAKVLALMLGIFLALLWPAAALATPTVPVVIVNHETGQCSQVIQGDDCSWCDPPTGWEVLGRAGESPCPEGYVQVDAPAMDCRRYETPFCCSGGVHWGDCEDMVIDEGAATCAFVDEIEGCLLPGNWQARPAGIEPRDWACPARFGWVQEEVLCLEARTATPEATIVAPEDTETTWRGICFGVSCLALAALLFGLAAVFPVWYAARQKERRTLPPSSKE